MDIAKAMSLAVLEMGTHHAALSYEGEMTQPGALALTRQFDRLFGYYQYPKIVLSIESPGGALDGLQYVLRSMAKWSSLGHQVAVRSTFLCASAGAFLLAMGAWGERRIDKGTHLLFHNARISGSLMPQATASMTSNLSKSLSNVDRSLLNQLVENLTMNAGGVDQLAKSIQRRLIFLEKDWANMERRMSTIGNSREATRRPGWIKSIGSWPFTNPSAFLTAYKRHLARSFDKDQASDLPESFVLCLIDEIVDVVSSQSPASPTSAQTTDRQPEQLPSPGSGESVPEIAGGRSSMVCV